MLKIRIYAALIAIVMTAITAYIAPIVYGLYTHWVDAMTPTQKAWLDWGQVALAACVAIYGFSRWKRKSKQSVE